MPFHGPYFDFLVLPAGAAWERRGRSGRPHGIRAEYFHHPDALRVSDVVVETLYECFRSAHPRFHFYGPTEYMGEPLAQLVEETAARIQTISACQQRDQLERLLSERVIFEATEEWGSWAQSWQVAQAELVQNANCILECAKVATRQSQALLVLGI